ncbi:hypothetical protein Sya03_22610 [Spirilliplanes yamanashiensis]|uniref:Uncharacterized protein n=1 Tax=Spirilliplanes yamanashiensis TaxID=42233 RepID=A0A8J4DJ16_9ACTN|nr:hypothetical protein Sya03_22610 [Spirilliplanes yamanashiensis]
MRNETRITTAGGGSRLAAEITPTAPAPLVRFAFPQARAAHAVLAERLRAALTPAGRPGRVTIIDRP